MIAQRVHPYQNPTPARLNLLQLCHDPHPHALVERAAHKQPLAVGAPVEAVDGLRGEGLVGEQLQGAGHPQLGAVLVLWGSLSKVRPCCCLRYRSLVICISDVYVF